MMRKLINKSKIWISNMNLKDYNKQDYKKHKQFIKRKLLGMQFVDGYIYKTIIYLMLIVLGFVFIYPLIYMVTTSLQTVEDVLDTSVYWIPSKLHWQNYKVAYAGLDYTSAFFKSILVALVPSLLMVISTSIVAYGFARFEFPLKKMWFALAIATFIIPRQLTHIPQFVWYSYHIHNNTPY